MVPTGTVADLKPVRRSRVLFAGLLSLAAKSSLFRVAFQSFRGCVQSTLLSGMVNRSLRHER